MTNKVNLILIFLIFAVMVAAQTSWNLDRIDARTGRDGVYNYQATGQGVRVYIADYPIWLEHPELEGRAVKGYGNYKGPCNDDGTAIAGVVGSRDYGVAKQVTMVSVAVGCTGFILAADLVRGLKWIARDCKRQSRCIVNISLKNGNYPTTNQAVQDLLDVGALVVVSAGNDTQDACFNWPNTDLLVVGATRQDDTAAPWSNFGSCVDLYAPGEGVWTITNGTIGTTYKSGTSYSAPHVSGLAAIYWELHPSATAAEVRDAITGNATPDVILGANPNLFIYSLW